MTVLSTVWIRLVVGDPKRFGLKQPKEPFSMRHPTVSQDIHSRLVHGDITPKGDIQYIDGKRVTFEDGSTADVDVIVQCTGYHIRFPFLDKGLIEARDNDIALFQRIFDPRYPDLSFIGLVQTLCAIMPISELQSHYIADYLKGEYHLPSQREMEVEAQAYHDMMKKRFTTSKSHTIQVDCNEYSYKLYKEWDAGKTR
jgi:dimethylaniline monooxygenase (N-oxide forming)